MLPQYTVSSSRSAQLSQLILVSVFFVLLFRWHCQMSISLIDFCIYCIFVKMALKRWSYFPLKPQNSPQHPCPVHSAEASPHHSCHNFLALLQTFSAYLYPIRPGTITHRPLSRFVTFARSLYLVSTVKAVKQLMSAILAMLLVVKTLENVPFICQKIHEYYIRH